MCACLGVEFAATPYCSHCRTLHVVLSGTSSPRRAFQHDANQPVELPDRGRQHRHVHGRRVRGLTLANAQSTTRFYPRCYYHYQPACYPSLVYSTFCVACSLTLRLALSLSGSETHTPRLAPALPRGVHPSPRPVALNSITPTEARSWPSLLNQVSQHVMRGLRPVRPWRCEF